MICAWVPNTCWEILRDFERELPLEGIPLWKDTREIDSERLRHAQIDKLCTALLLERFNFGPPSDLTQNYSQMAVMEDSDKARPGLDIQS